MDEFLVLGVSISPDTIKGGQRYRPSIVSGEIETRARTHDRPEIARPLIVSGEIETKFHLLNKLQREGTFNRVW